METVNKIKQAFEFLQENCGAVALIDFVKKEEIQDGAERKDYDDVLFSHEYQLIRNGCWDEGDFWGDIYLPLFEDLDLYMRFEVHA